MNEFPGEISASFIEIRFAYGGQVAKVNKHPGDAVKRNELIASLDRTFLQVDLDKQLSDYEKVRADFELFNIKHGKGPDSDDTVKYMRTIQQAALNGAVKDIESAKFKMDQADMFSPVNGVITNIQGLTPGMYVTPASNPVVVLDLASLVFQMEVSQDELFQFYEERMMKINIPGFPDAITAHQKLPTYGKNGKFLVPIPLPITPHLYPGMKGQATFKLD